MTVLITGAAKGLGREIALFLAQKKLPILAHYRGSVKEMAELVKRGEGRIRSLQGDFSTRMGIEDFCSMLDSEKEIRYLVHNVGNYIVKGAGDTPIDEWESLFYPNLLAPVAITQKILPMLMEKKGAVIMIGATGLERADSQSAAYTALKAALLSTTRSLAKELAPKRVAVNMVSPGVLPNSVNMKNSALLPQGAPVHFEEVAKTVLFLLEDESRSITGQNIEIAAGQRL